MNYFWKTSTLPIAILCANIALAEPQLDSDKALTPGDLSSYPPPLPPKEEDKTELEEIVDFLERTGKSVTTDTKVRPVENPPVAPAQRNIDTSTMPVTESLPPAARKQPAPPSATATEYDVRKIYSSIHSRNTQPSLEAEPAPTPTPPYLPYEEEEERPGFRERFLNFFRK